MRAQEFIHWLEMGAGARWLRRTAILAVALALSLLISWRQFRGPQSEATLEQADMGRQVARGQGFSTLVNYPQTAALAGTRGQAFDPARPYPSVHHAPLYAGVIGAGLKLLPEARRESLFAMPDEPSAGYGGDYYLLAINLLLFWAAAGLTYLLASRLFEPRVGWVSALGVLVSQALWQQTMAVNGTTLLMVLALATFLVWWRVERDADAGERAEAAPESDAPRPPSRWRQTRDLAVLGACCGLLFLAEYSAGMLLLVALGYALFRFRARRRWTAAACLAAGFAVVAGPWGVRNIGIAGHPVALAAQNVALKAGDPTAEPASVRATLSAEGPALSLRKLGNKTLTSLQENLRTRLWSGGAMWFAAFFVAGLLYSFRSGVANRIRWVFAIALAVLLLSQSALNSGESERHVVVWLSPLVIIFGAGFFFVLLSANAVLGAWPRALGAVLILAQAIPLAHTALAPPPGVRFYYPPYFPALLRGVRTELEQRNVVGRFGAMADVPAGLAWYGDLRVWAQPAGLRDFYAVTLEQPIGELLLTPRTLDRPFFSELNARAVAPGALSSVANRFGEWGEIYAGLVTGNMPREFPLRTPHRVAENLYVLLNPALPPSRGK